MSWHDVSDPSSAQMGELAARYSLHTLHVEDVRQSAQRTKVENGGSYLFCAIKIPFLEENHSLRVADLGLFLGADFLITVHNQPVPVLEPLRQSEGRLRADEVLYRITDRVVDSYLPLIDTLEDVIEQLQDVVVGQPRPDVLDSIGRVRDTLMHLRRVLGDTRRAALRLRHIASALISRELHPFLRDVNDDLAIDLDTIAGQRERLNGVLDAYLSSVANRTTEATRTLTLMGTIAVPALVITGLFGMNVQYPAWTHAPWALWLLTGITIAVTVFLFWYLKRNDYLPGGSTSRQEECDGGMRTEREEAPVRGHGDRLAMLSRMR